MAFDKIALRTCLIGLAIGAAVAIAAQLEVLPIGKAGDQGASTSAIGKSAPNQSRWRQCVSKTRASEGVCRCATKFLDSPSLNPVLGGLAFGGKAPAGYVPKAVKDPATYYAEDVKSMEVRFVAECQREEAEDNATRPVWMKYCEADGNSSKACGCFYDGMKDRLDGGSWQRFRREIHQDLTALGDMFGPIGGTGDRAIEEQLNITKQIAVLMPLCGLKPANR